MPLLKNWADYIKELTSGGVSERQEPGAKRKKIPAKGRYSNRPDPGVKGSTKSLSALTEERRKKRSGLGPRGHL